ncbi:MAG: aminomethyl-transferring glycine dehydrogenase subunit GcvPA [Clostridia bacterium]
MRSYVPNTLKERNEMLKEIGVDSVDGLFSDISSNLRLNRTLAIGEDGVGLSELEIRRVFKAYADSNQELPLFRGAGAYRHYIPAIVPQIVSRSELYTAYTPYQAEMSQGMLQAIFEFQTFVCALTGLDAANASVYDGATAAAETMHMVCDVKRKKKVLVSAGLHPDVLTTMKTYARFSGIEIVVIPLNRDGSTDIYSLEANLRDSAGLFVAVPNFYGVIEDADKFSAMAHENNALMIEYVNPISLGAIKRPKDIGADIAIGDGQTLGIPISFGGPYVGFMSCTSKLMRNLPGRIVGQTADAEGNRAFVLTLQAREQHIRREKASSNICSNQMLCAIMSSIYLACMGKEGMKEVADQNIQKAHYLMDGLTNVCGMTLRYNAPFFNEFVTDSAIPGSEINDILKEKGFIGGLPLSRLFPGDNGVLWCATECNTRDEIDALIGALEVKA